MTHLYLSVYFSIIPLQLLLFTFLLLIQGRWAYALSWVNYMYNGTYMYILDSSCEGLTEALKKADK